MTTEKLSLGFIGGGLSSAVGAVHYSASQLDGRWTLEAGAFSRAEDVNRATGTQWHVNEERVYKNWRELIDQEGQRLDAVCVLTPTPGHAENIKELLNVGLPIICEKSITMNLGEALDFREQLADGSTFFTTTFNYTGYPMVRELKARIARGDLGTIQQIHIEMPQEGLVRPPAIAGKSAPPQSWRLTDGRIPTICLDLGVHMDNLATFVTGQRPTATMAEFGNFSPYAKLVDYAKYLLRFDGGAKGTYWMTKTALGNRNGLDLRVFGDKGSASWHQMDPEQLHLAYADGRTEKVDRGGPCLVAGDLRYSRFKAGHPSGFLEAFANLYADIGDALSEYRRHGRYENPYVFDYRDALDGLALFEAGVTSVNEERWIEIKDPLAL